MKGYIMRPQTNTPSLWTRDFTILTLGSAVSMIGATLSGFAVSMMVLDDTGSTFLFVLFNVCCQLPFLICPLLAGPYLDRMSRKKVIYGLDFLSAGLYLLLFYLIRQGWYTYPIMLGANLLIGCINSVYSVAYESFYPNLITPGNHQKAYSVSTLLWDIGGLAYPLGAVLYETLGSPEYLFAANALCFFLAACFETRIRHRETHMAAAPRADGVGTLKQFGRDFKEGVQYIAGEQGLLAITLYFMFSNFAGGGGELYLPWFNNHPELFALWPVAAVTLYSIVSNFSSVGRILSAAVQYLVKIPRERRFAAALLVYACLSVLDMVTLYVPVPVMALLFFISGVLSVTSYNIRITATQSYIPDGKRARFNGAFQMLNTVGSIAGSLTAGALAEVMDERRVILLLNLVCLGAVYGFIYRRRKHVAAIYNREV